MAIRVCWGHMEPPCSQFDLIITNTVFQQRNQLKATWMHPRSKHWHLLDYVIVRRSDRLDVHLTGAECWTDHRLVRSTVRLEIRPPVRKHKPKKKLNVKACQDPSSQLALQQVIADKLSCIPDTDPTAVKALPLSPLTGPSSAIVSRKPQLRL